MIQKLLDKLLKKKTNLETTIENYINLYTCYNGNILKIKQQTSSIYSKDKKENILFLIYFLLNFSKILKNPRYVNDYESIKIYEEALDFVIEQMPSYNYHNIFHVYDVIENVCILYVMDYFTNSTRDKNWRLDTNNVNLVSSIFSVIFHDVFYSHKNSYMNEKISSSICEEFLSKYTPSDFKSALGNTVEFIHDSEFQETIIECTYSDIMRTKVGYYINIMYDLPNDCSNIVHDADILSSFISLDMLLYNTLNIIKEYNLIPEDIITEDDIKTKALEFLKNKKMYGLKSFMGLDVFDEIRNNLITELEGE